jgi:excisionase family DNA binding protein
MAELLITEAADRLGVSVDTIRRRIRAGALSHRRDARGRWLVEVEDVPRQNGGATTALPGHAQAEPTQPAGGALWAPAPVGSVPMQELIDTLQSEVSYLRELVRTRDEDLRRRDELLDHEREQYAQEREALHARLHEALGALAMQRALSSGAPEPAAAPPPNGTPAPRPWWRFWWHPREH